MQNKKWLFWGGIFILALLGGLLGGFNLRWSRMPQFPVYGYVLDAVVVPLFFLLLFYVRKLKSETTDEFDVAKKRYAAQSGLMVGLVIFILSGLWPIFSRSTYEAFIVWAGTPDDIFTMGRVFGIVPIVIGLIIGQVGAWLKYR